MPCCCVNTLNLCSVPVCGSITFDKLATAGSGDNEYILILDFLDTSLQLTQAQTEGENITFDISMLNENFQYTGQIFDSENQVVSITVDTVSYDCVKFKTKINIIL